jgi:ribosome biogenesis protein ERB1
VFCSWSKINGKEYDQGYRLQITHKQPVSSIAWHRKGDYFVSVTTLGGQSKVLVHQLSQCQTQSPFSKPDGPVSRALFHPAAPYLFVATQRHVKVFNLAKQSTSKKLMSGVKWISSMDVHPQGKSKSSSF